MMDEIARYNRERWKALAEANALFTRPALHLDPSTAREKIDPDGILGELAGRRVLCLAGAGGQQSAAFALLGAHVTVLDLSEPQLQRDREVAAHYHVPIDIIQGDMRDLSCFAEAAFDIVWHPYSLNFIPDARIVFRQVARVLRHDGIYHFHCANPFYSGLSEKDWNGNGYALKHPYINGAEMTYDDQDWAYGQSDGPIPKPIEYRHTLSTLINGLIEQGFVILRVSDSLNLAPDPNAEAGTWEHFTSVAPPWLAFWAAYRPEIFGK